MKVLGASLLLIIGAVLGAVIAYHAVLYQVDRDIRQEQGL